MLIFYDANLVFFAVPKTGSTAYHLALRDRADMVLDGKTPGKHMILRSYVGKLAPQLLADHGLVPERLAVMREPLEQLRSWYRYRLRPEIAGSETSAAGMSFDAFVEANLQDPPAEVANVGTQARFLTGPKGQVLVDHLFAYERPELLNAFLSARLGMEVCPGLRNVSPPAPAPISPDVEARFRQARRRDYEIYAEILAADGYLRSPVPR